MAENMFNWQFNTIPGNANQGAILMTRNDIGQPPFNQSDFIWKAMEDVIGVANVKFEYDEDNNKFHIYKATGHKDNEGNWTYDWEEYGSWDALTEEAAETLRKLVYVDYIFEQTSIGGTEIVTIKGIKKDDTVDVIATLTFVSKAYVDEAIRALQEYLLVFINKKWEYKGEVQDSTILSDNAPFGSVYRVENESDMFVNIATSGIANWIPFTKIYENYTAGAVKLTKGTNGVYADLRYDSIDFLIDQAQHLKLQIIDDTLDASSPLANRKTYSIDKILQLLSQAMRYKGQVDYYDLLPSTGNVAGDTWNVKYSGTSAQGGTELDGDNYAWNGTSWDNLSGEYRAGVGIQIEGKVISATGISFNVGSGIKITGSGSNAVLETRNGDGLEYQNVGTTANPIYANAVKEGYGIVVDNTGVNVSTNHGIAIDSNNNVVLKHNSDIVVNNNNEATVPIKTINNSDIHGTGNINLRDYQTFYGTISGSRDIFKSLPIIMLNKKTGILTPISTFTFKTDLHVTGIGWEEELGTYDFSSITGTHIADLFMILFCDGGTERTYGVRLNLTTGKLLARFDHIVTTSTATATGHSSIAVGGGELIA